MLCVYHFKQSDGRLTSLRALLQAAEYMYRVQPKDAIIEEMRQQVSVEINLQKRKTLN